MTWGRWDVVTMAALVCAIGGSVALAAGLWRGRHGGLRLQVLRTAVVCLRSAAVIALVMVLGLLRSSTPRPAAAGDLYVLVDRSKSMDDERGDVTAVLKSLSAWAAANRV